LYYLTGHLEPSDVFFVPDVGNTIEGTSRNPLLSNVHGGSTFALRRPTLDFFLGGQRSRTARSERNRSDRPLGVVNALYGSRDLLVVLGRGNTIEGSLLAPRHFPARIIASTTRTCIPPPGGSPDVV